MGTVRLLGILITVFPYGQWYMLHWDFVILPLPALSFRMTRLWRAGQLVQLLFSGIVWFVVWDFRSAITFFARLQGALPTHPFC